MNKVPRASFGIPLLRDADYMALIRTPEGREAIMAFFALVLTGRERLQEGKAVRHEQYGLRFTEKSSILSALCGLDVAIIRKAVTTIGEVCKANENQPWLFASEERLVIRSFFKFNTREGWGGKRRKSGRKTAPKESSFSSGNQDETNLKSPSTNQDDFKLIQDGATPAPVLAPVLAPSPVSKKSRKRSGPIAYTQDYLEWYGRYPKHVGKQEGMQVWDRLTPDERKQAFLGLPAVIANHPGEQANFAPHPATWLGNSRWEDEKLPTKGQKAVGQIGQTVTNDDEEYEREAREHAAKVVLAREALGLERKS